MGTHTLGVSIAVPEPYGSLLQERRVSYGDTAAHGIPTHVTLLPPTEVDDEGRSRIEAHLSAIAEAGRSFPMRLAGTDTFRPMSPVVFVQVVEGGSACAWLQEQVRSPGGPLDRELSFPYHPHVTVAHGIAEEAMDKAYEELADFEASWTATGFALYEQGADGVWRLQREFRFHDAADAPASRGAVHTGPTPDEPDAGAGLTTVERANRASGADRRKRRPRPTAGAGRTEPSEEGHRGALPGARSPGGGGTEGLPGGVPAQSGPVEPESGPRPPAGASAQVADPREPANRVDTQPWIG